MLDPGETPQVPQALTTDEGQPGLPQAFEQHTVPSQTTPDGELDLGDWGTGLPDDDEHAEEHDRRDSLNGRRDADDDNVLDSDGNRDGNGDRDPASPAAPDGFHTSHGIQSQGMPAGQEAARADGGHGGSDAESRNKSGSRRASHAETPLKQSLRDPLLVRPRWSAVAWSAVLGVLLLLAGAALWWGSVRTLPGQVLDDLVWQNLYKHSPSWLVPLASVITSRYVIDTFIALCGLGSLMIVIIRRRWVLLVQMTVFTVLAVGVHLLKYVLPRPVFDPHLPNPSNTSPSGHTMAILTACLLLVMACSLSWRVWTALFAALATGVGAVSLVICRWHRPSDVTVSILLTGGLALLTLAFTRGSGMDRPGARRSSAGIQIVSVLLLVTGVAGIAWTVYLLVQLWPGLSIPARWVTAPACHAALLAIVSVDLLVNALVLICRQATASPLSTLGLLGGPPKPARNKTARTDHRRSHAA